MFDASQVESFLKKANSFYVIEKDPGFFFLFDDFYDVTDVNLSLNNLFMDEYVSILIRYNLSYVNIYLTSESNEFLRIENLPFHEPKHFQLIKPMANMFNGKDVMGRRLSNELVIAAGNLLTGGGVAMGIFYRDNQRLWKINNFSTQLIP